MNYVTYEFYTDTWGGKLAEAVFQQSVQRAEQLLDYMTKRRLPMVWDALDDGSKKAVGMAVCTLIDGYIAAGVGDAEKISETVGKHSVTYAAASHSRLTRMRSAVRPYLDGIVYNGVTLLYRGVEEGCPCAYRK